MKVVSADFRASSVRFVSGFILCIVGLLTVAFVVPSMQKKYISNSGLQDDILRSRHRQEKELNEMHVEANWQLLEKFMMDIQVGDGQKLRWELSNTLYDLSAKHEVRILNVKYTPIVRLAIIGDNLESLSVDFDISGDCIHLKNFMLALEKSNRNSIVVEAKLEKDDESSHLAVKLFTFWRVPTASVMQAVSRL